LGGRIYAVVEPLQYLNDTYISK